jgi:hypothetical protein
MILAGRALRRPVEEPLRRRKCPKSAYNGFMILEDIRAIWRNLAQPRKPALPTSQPALAMGNRLTPGVHLVLEPKNLRHLIGLRDVLLEQSPQPHLIKCSHSDAQQYVWPEVPGGRMKLGRPGSVMKESW